MLASQSEKADIFRALHGADKGFIIPNPWDIGSAKILASLGFKALATTSAGFAWGQGKRDAVGAVKREEALHHGAEIVAATDLPVSADLEDGFGPSPEAAADTIRQAGIIGLVGGSIEDASQHSVLDMGLAVERVAAAVEAAHAHPFPFTLTARTENYLCGNPDLGDTIARLQAYEAAGADVLYAPALPDIETIKTVCQSVGKPVNVVIGLGAQNVTVNQLFEAGVQRISLGSSLAKAAYGALLQAAQEIQTKGTTNFIDPEFNVSKINSLMSE